MTNNDASLPEDVPPKKGLSRRSVLGATGAGVAAVAVGSTGVAFAGGGRRRGDPDRARGGRRGEREPNGRKPSQGGSSHDVGTSPDVDRFSRMFDEPVYAEPSPHLTDALVELGRPGGMMDANDPLEVGPIRLITEPELSPDNRDNPTHTAGVTFVGQFLDHDITRDAGSRLTRPTGVGSSFNLRSARFDLDSVYGGGPNRMRELYERRDPFRLRVESGGRFEDLPRDANGNAIVGDDRNDENVMISGLHAAFLMFHNAVLDRVRATGLGDEVAFREARRQVVWHYQWLIVHEWLPAFVG